MEYLELEDYLLIAEAVLGVPAEALTRVINVSLAESALAAPRAGYGKTEFYPEPAVKAGILCARLIRNHPAPDGNKRVALVALLEFIERNGLTWRAPQGGQDEIAEMIERLAGKEPPLREEAFVAWVVAHISSAGPP